MKLLVDGLAVNYDDTGKGPVILMLHGWGSNLQVYDNLTLQLKKNYRVVRFDWPGFGGSELPKTTWGIDEFTVFAAAFCAKLGVSPDILVGHSMGGQTAVHLVGSGQLKPQKLILLAASAVRPAQGTREMLYKLIAKSGKHLVRGRLAERLKHRLYRQTGTSDYLNSGQMQASYRQIVTQDQTGLARNITIPTLVLWGDQDNDAPLERGKLLASIINHSQLEVLPGAGHYMFVDEPERSLQIINEFLSSAGKKVRAGE